MRVFEEYNSGVSGLGKNLTFGLFFRDFRNIMITSVELKHLDTSFSGLTTFQGDSGVKKIMLVMIIFN